jgi:hypothetical protein
MKTNDILLHKADGAILLIHAVVNGEVHWEAQTCTGFSLIENIEEFFDIVGEL